MVRRLWDGWEDDAEIRDVATRRFIDRDRLHRVDFDGRFFSVRGPSITPRPPQVSRSWPCSPTGPGRTSWPPAVSLLQERGSLRAEYTGSTLRDNLGLPGPASAATAQAATGGRFHLGLALGAKAFVEGPFGIHYELTPTGPRVGAEVTGLDLRQDATRRPPMGCGRRCGPGPPLLHRAGQDGCRGDRRHRRRPDHAGRRIVLATSTTPTPAPGRTGCSGWPLRG